MVNIRLFGGGCGRRRSLAGYWINRRYFLYQANFPASAEAGRRRSLAGYMINLGSFCTGQNFLGLGRGLRKGKQVPV